MTRGESRLWPLLPAAVALLAFANTIPGDFVFDDVILIERGESLHDLDLRRIFLSNYWGPDRADRNYRPLTLLSYALNWKAGGESAWSFHAVNVLLNAAVAFLAFLVLRELGIRTPLAVLAASLYTVLPIHVEAVANIVGRAEILAGLAILGVWLIALRNPGDDRPGKIAAAAGVTFLGLCAKESVITAIPLIVAAAWVLRRKIPWRTAGACCAAAGLYAAIYFQVLQGKENNTTFVDNPLAFTDPTPEATLEGEITRAVNALRILGIYIAKTVAPVRLSADYSFDQVPVLPLPSPWLWLQAGAVAGGLAACFFLSRRRAPLGAVAVVFFLVTFAITSNVLIPIGTILGERLAYTPSFAYPLGLCALAAAWTGGSAARGRTVIVLLAILTAAYGARTWARNGDWADAALMDIRMAADSPASTRAQLKAAEGYVKLWNESGSAREKVELLGKALEHIDESLRIFPDHGRAIAKRGEVFLHQGRYEEAAVELARAVTVMAAGRPPELEPVVLLLRAEALTRLERYVEALEESERYVKVLERRRAPPSAPGHLSRGLALAGLGRLREALADFERAVDLRPDLPEARANRGYCRFLLDDLRGALEDYQKGLEICRAAGILHDPGGESVRSFLLKAADVHEKAAALRRSEGNEAAARESEARAAKLRAEAEGLRPGGR
jgi:tetratricopeptide (TPR) repeat protein